MEVIQTGTESVRRHVFSNDTGDAEVVEYPLFPGVVAAYITVHMDTFDFRLTESERREQYVGFHWCCDGRIEQESDGEFFYLMPGDCSVVVQDRHVKNFRFPTKHYHGISIGIDTGIATDSFSELLRTVGVNPLEVAMKICGDRHNRVLRCPGCVERILRDLYEAREEIRLNYFRIKLHELLYVMHVTEFADAEEEATVPLAQVRFVKQVAAYVSEHLNGKITVKELTKRFGVSDTYLQNSFRLVYGMPVISFIRAQKMQRAAQALIHTDRSVDDVAEEFGYSNESKFSAVFKRIMGDTPSVYRKEHSKVKIL